MGGNSSDQRNFQHVNLPALWQAHPKKLIMMGRQKDRIQPLNFGRCIHRLFSRIVTNKLHRDASCLQNSNFEEALLFCLFLQNYLQCISFSSQKVEYSLFGKEDFLYPFPHCLALTFLQSIVPSKNEFPSHSRPFIFARLVFFIYYLIFKCFCDFFHFPHKYVKCCFRLHFLIFYQHYLICPRQLILNSVQPLQEANSFLCSPQINRTGELIWLKNN